ncbi:cytochrome P450 [Dendrothele bispora CBS 962.96]|uniref:Cytochrome P450 n=1 Tax=Dendrothele bispora (strain CBS 962.96) TaxID=1314807 RepID=A0A4S8MFK5_DENBC|nr:cytochrome P450 [Dendrothele bispora CBS 962.96]
MNIFLQILASCLGALALVVFYLAAKSIYANYRSPLRLLPGPKSVSWFFGNLRQIQAAENAVLHEQWTEEYGPTIKYNAFFNTLRLYTTDTKALNHVLMNHYIYQKPEMAAYNLSLVLGSGILIMEEDKHRMQRKVMNPAFGAAQIRELTEIFFEKSLQLRDIWAAQVSQEGSSAQLDVLSWLSRMTLDVIGLAGFNYKFDALSGEINELNKAFNTVFSATNRIDYWGILQALFPVLRILPSTRPAAIDQARNTMTRIGKELLHESKASLTATGEKGNNWRARDLLSLLLRSNMDTQLPENQRMSDEDVVSQVPTFLVAGHETTSTGTTWALYSLSLNKDVQTKLREELFTLSTDSPTMDELNSLPYLDAAVRETLRVHAPVPSTVRVAVKDDIVPLGTPYRDVNGVTHDSILVEKGQTIFIPILAMNRDPKLWGEDAKEFRPERWEKVPEAVSAIPGVWGNLLTFLGGARSCIGYRFSLIEMKALLFTLVRAFEFELAVPVEDIGRKSAIVTRPFLKSVPEKGSQLPLIVRQYQRP